MAVDSVERRNGGAISKSKSSRGSPPLAHVGIKKYEAYGTRGLDGSELVLEWQRSEEIRHQLRRCQAF